MFSPWYHWSGRQRPEDHVALNVALYGVRPGWAMTERGAAALERSAEHLAIGPSRLRWHDDALTVDVAEWTFPIPSRFRGQVRVRPRAIARPMLTLDAAGRHVWSPIATRADVEVDFARPSLRWRGTGYFDCNWGSEPLEDGFASWQWSRAHLAREEVVLYEGLRRDGSRFAHGLRFDGSGSAREIPLPQEVILPGTRWRMPRMTRADAGASVAIRRTWEDTPFYARTSLATQLFGEPAEAVHESIDLDRLANPVVKWMLPFRMPRIAR